jgi:PAS domain S-box-containing protein
MLNPNHFHFKLLAGSSAGVVVIAAVAIIYVIATFSHQSRERMRAHTIEVMRLAGVVENDVSALENAHRGHLLAHNGAYLENFGRLEARCAKDCDALSGVLTDLPQQKRLWKMRGNIRDWFSNSSALISDMNHVPRTAAEIKAALNSPEIEESHGILQTILREEQIKLNQRMGDEEWAARSTQVLNFIPMMERAVYDLQKEKRAYILTGDAAFLDAYERATSDFYTFQAYLAVLLANEPAQATQLNAIRDRLEGWITQYALPETEAKRTGHWSFALTNASAGDALINAVRRAIEQFDKEQLDLYQTRSAAAERDRILQVWAIELCCALAAALMIGSSGYNCVLYRRQLKKLRGADTRIRAVVDHIFDGMITIDENGVITSMNPAVQRMFGYRPNESFGRRLTALIPKYFPRENDGTALACHWPQLAKRTGGTTLALAQTRMKATFPVELSLTEIMVEQQRFYVAIIRDNTERKRTEEALASEKNDLATEKHSLAAEKNSLAVTLASIGDGVITIDLNGRIGICNKAAETMTGWPATEVAGKALRSVFTLSADAATQRKNNGAIGYRSEAEAILFGTPERATLASRDGVERLIEQAASPIRDADNNLSGVVLVFRDITERERDAAERRKTEALDQLGLLAGGIAHDFNNLLTAIIGNVSLVSMLLPASDEKQGRLEDAKNASMRARDLAQQLLTFARGGAPTKQNASIADLVQETVSFSLRGSHISSNITIAPDLWSAEFDPGQISQVIANLVVNADQAMPNGGTLDVTCENFSHTAAEGIATVELAVGDYIRIQVHDEGTGIAPHCLKRIFDPYFTTKSKGSGLGLATCYSIVKNHNGLVTVESELHCGSTFTVYLPAARQGAAEVQPVPLTDQPLQGSGRVLIVDDEEAIRMLVEFTLTALGYEVAAAETSLRGIELYREALECGKRFDLVILDLTLPGGMGGKDALRKLIEIDPMVNAIVSSGYAMDATMSRYQDFGFRGMIAKPYEAAELARKVGEMIEADHDHQQAPDCEFQHAC